MKREFNKGDGTTTRFAYVARERFGPWDGKGWLKYLDFARLPQLSEVLFDSSLCPALANVNCDEDWNHNIHDDFITHYHWDLSYLRTKIPTGSDFNLLAVTRNATSDPKEWQSPDGFHYVGSDLIDEHTGISAITNCGGFDDVFPRSEVSPLGLIEDWSRAVELQAKLAAAHPEEPHAQCDVWSIWRWENS